jgi:hypothetical protein
MRKRYCLIITAVGNDQKGIDFGNMLEKRKTVLIEGCVGCELF